jgi:DNA invertase Pin-like site-specific DNA recombinase
MGPSSLRRAAIYVRVSSDAQTTDCQYPEIERLVRARGYTLVATYEEQSSAAKRRPEYERMMRDAKKGAFNVLVIWAIDRFGRSMIANMNDVLELDRVGVEVVSVRETWLDTGGPVRNLLVAIFSWAAEQERNRLIERTKVGLAAARRRGARIGRPRARIDHDDLLELHEQGWSVARIAAHMKVGTSTVQRRLVQLRDAGRIRGAA